MTRKGLCQGRFKDSKVIRLPTFRNEMLQTILQKFIIKISKPLYCPQQIIRICIQVIFLHKFF